MTALLNCPFCSSPAEWFDYKPRNTFTYEKRVRCSNELCCGEHVNATQAEWNRRPTPPADAVYSAYLGICVLSTMCRKAGLTLAVQRSKELLLELGTAFPFIAERVGASALRTEDTATTPRTPDANIAPPDAIRCRELEKALANLLKWIDEGGTKMDFALAKSDARAVLAGVLATPAKPDAVVEALREALKDARNYVDATACNATNPKRKANYRECVARLDAALALAGTKEK